MRWAVTADLATAPVYGKPGDKPGVLKNNEFLWIQVIGAKAFCYYVIKIEMTFTDLVLSTNSAFTVGNLSGKMSYNPDTDTVIENLSATLSVNGVFSYQWFRNTSASTTGGTALGNPVVKDITGAITYAPGSATNDDFELELPDGEHVVDYYYYVAVASSVTTKYSNVAKITVTDLSSGEFTISVPPTSSTYNITTTPNPTIADLSVTLSANGAYLVQWYKALGAAANPETDTKVGTGGKTTVSGPITFAPDTGDTGFSTTLSGGVHSVTYPYYAVIKNAVKTVTSNVATIAIADIDGSANLAFTQDLTSKTYSFANSANPPIEALSVTVNETGSFIVQWYKSTSASTTGGTALGTAVPGSVTQGTPITYTLGTDTADNFTTVLSPNSSEDYYYYVVITGAARTLTSAVATIRVTNISKPGPLEEGKPNYSVHKSEIDAIIAQMTWDEKIGQMTQAERGQITHSNTATSWANVSVNQYFLGSVLSGGGSGPGAGTSASNTANSSPLQW
jgi:hypothetical protein